MFNKFDFDHGRGLGNLGLLIHAKQEKLEEGANLSSGKDCFIVDLWPGEVRSGKYVQLNSTECFFVKAFQGH